MHRSFVLALPVAFSLVALGCGSGGGGELVDVSTSVCPSGLQWQSGNEGSSSMHPGADCIACHSSSGGPSFGIAGTVFSTLDAPTDCGGVDGVTVRITDANGDVHELTSNAAGNFYMSSSDFAAIVTPFNVEVESGGNVSAMPATLTSGACNGCHTATGANGAPGRVVAP